MGAGRQGRTERVSERGSAVVAVLVLLSASLLVVIGARLFGGAAVEELRCQGEAVRAIGSGSAAGCGTSGGAVAQLAPSPADPAEVGTGETPEAPPPPDSVVSKNQSARETLAPLFDIRPPGFFGWLLDSVSQVVLGTAENQVSEEEFDEIVRLYSDIREGRTRFLHTRRVDPYWDAVMADLARILQTEGGRDLVSRLAYHSRSTFISVAFRRDEAGVAYPERGLDPTVAESWNNGAIAYVTYAPGEWWQLPGVDTELQPWAVIRSDVALYHELVHILDFHDGTNNPDLIDEDGESVRALEYRAVGLGDFADEPISENAYRAARREIGDAGLGAASGDVGMPHRPRYVIQYPAAEPPGPQPSPAGDP